MDIKDLNKSQLILLALLISFVTSIATGIATVSLMQQAPDPVVQTINRVVQKTIETVVPDSTKKTQTVIIKEQDLIVDAIAKNEGNVVPIKNAGEDSGRGFLVSADGLILTDARYAPQKGDYTVNYQGTELKADFVSADPSGFSILKAVLPSGKDAKITAFTFSDLGDSTLLKVGQTAVALDSGTSLAQGIISGFTDRKIVLSPAIPAGETGGPADEKSETIKLINISANLSKVFAGGPVVDIDGNVIGLAVSADGEMIILPSSIAKDAIMSLNKKTS
jgi:S1-C subfamily serine protease